MRDDYFEWDDEKSKTNKVKHGIDFEEARSLWAHGVDEFPFPRGIEIRHVAFGGRYSRLAVPSKQRAAKMRMARRAKTSKRPRLRDKVLERFESGKSIADYIDFSAGRFVKIA